MTNDFSTADPYQRGRQLQREGKLVEAAACYREALSQRPDDDRALHQLGLMAQQSGDFRAAESLLRSAAGFGARNPDYHVSLGLLLQETGQPHKAIDAFRTALTINPQHFHALFRLGALLQLRGETAAALDQYEQALALDSDDLQLLDKMAALLNHLEQHDRAVELSRHAIALRPELPGAHRNLGNALAALRQFEPAIESFRRSLTLQPHQPAVYASLGKCLLATGELAGAEHAFENCLRREPADTVSLTVLAVLTSMHEPDTSTSALLDYDGLLATATLTPPPNQDALKFLEKLHANVLTHSQLREDGSDRVMLLPSQQPAINHLVGCIREHVARYIAARPAEWKPLHGLGPLWSPPGAWRLDLWATAANPTGQQPSRIDEKAWLNGAIWIPSRMSNATDDTFEFGALPRDLTVRRQLPVYRQPLHAGQIVLFPSFFFHRWAGPVARDAIRLEFAIVPRRENTQSR